MPPMTRWPTALTLVLSLAAIAVAQDAAKPLPAPQSRNTLASRPLLMEPAVQKAIGLSEKQRTNLALIEEEYSLANQGDISDPGEEGFDFNTMMAGADDLAKQQRAAIAKLLTSPQKARLLQIEWQREGWIALGRADLAAKINLKNNQTQKIRSIIGTMRQNQSKVVFAVPDAVAKAQQNPRPRPDLNPSNGFQGNGESVLPGGGPMNFTAEEFQAQTNRTIELSATVLADSAKEVAALLTLEQKTAFERALGPPFDFNSLNATPVSTTPRTTPARKRNSAPKSSSKPK